MRFIVIKCTHTHTHCNEKKTKLSVAAAKHGIPCSTSMIKLKKVCKIGAVAPTILLSGFYLLGGGGGREASTPNTISSPLKHNYKFIIILVFVSFLN